MQPIVSVKEARKLLGDSADAMSDDEILKVINTLDLLAKDALQLARENLRKKKDADDLANLVYDIYQEDKLKRKPAS